MRVFPLPLIVSSVLSFTHLRPHLPQNCLSLPSSRSVSILSSSYSSSELPYDPPPSSPQNSPASTVPTSSDVDVAFGSGSILSKYPTLKAIVKFTRPHTIVSPFNNLFLSKITPLTNHSPPLQSTTARHDPRQRRRYDTCLGGFSWSPPPLVSDVIPCVCRFACPPPWQCFHCRAEPDL